MKDLLHKLQVPSIMKGTVVFGQNVTSESVSVDLRCPAQLVQNRRLGLVFHSVGSFEAMVRRFGRRYGTLMVIRFKFWRRAHDFVEGYGSVRVTVTRSRVHMIIGTLSFKKHIVDSKNTWGGVVLTQEYRP